jgi:hypothetical protein
VWSILCGLVGFAYLAWLTFPPMALLFLDDPR